MGADAAARRFVWIAGLPIERGHRIGEVNGVLTRPACDLENEAVGRHDALQDFDDGSGVASHGRRKQSV